MAKWYWILAAACLIATVGISVSTWQKAQHRNVEELRKEGMSAVFNERWDQARDNLEVVIQSGDASERDWFMYGLAVHYQGDYQQSIKIFEKAEKMGFLDSLTQYNIACGYAQLGRPDEAFEHLEHAVENGWIDSVWMRQDADLEPIRHLERFDEIVKLVSQRQSSMSEEELNSQPPIRGFGSPSGDKDKLEDNK